MVVTPVWNELRIKKTSRAAAACGKCTAEGRTGEGMGEKENKGETGMDELSKGKLNQKTSDG